MSNDSRRLALEAAGLVHPRPEAVTSPLFTQGNPFFFALDKMQVKYEMLRCRRRGRGHRHGRGPQPRRPAPSSTWWLPLSTRRA